MIRFLHGGALLLAALATAGAHADCLLVTDAADGRPLREEGRCGQRITPASTFKIAIAAMGYDAGILRDEHRPALAWGPGDTDWNPAWRTTVDPQSWIRDSVVWYSQRVTARLGAARFQAYAKAFRYGNADVRGDPVKHDGLRWAWIDSSLRISPREQADFLGRLVRHELPVRDGVADQVARITAIAPGAGGSGGWELHGKTGTGFPFDAAGHEDHDHAYGWFVGWAVKGPRTLVFVRQAQDGKREEGAAGLRARAALLPRLPALLDAALASTEGG